MNAIKYIPQPHLQKLPILILLLTTLACQKQPPPVLTGLQADMQTHLYIDDNEHIYFSTPNRAERYAIYRYKDGYTAAAIWGDGDYAFPGSINTEIVAAKSTYGKDSYSLALDLASDININHFITNQQGTRLLYASNNAIQYGSPGTLKVLLPFQSRFNGVSFFEEKVLISADTSLWLIDEMMEKTRINTGIPGRKYNPYLFDSTVLFSSNANSEFFQLYVKTPNKQEIVSGNHDLRMPVLRGSYLYYLEIVKGEYLLKRRNIHTEQVHNITEEGVVYQYEFINDTTLALIYSDADQPRSLMRYNIGTNHMEILYGDTVEMNYTIRFVEESPGNSRAYLYEPEDEEKVRGSILYFYPSNDFSPRYDAILHNLATNGYRIVIPVYPGTFGYGKTYRSAGMEASLQALLAWKEKVREIYDGQLIYLSRSSGNRLMEYALAMDPGGVDYFYSLFGIPGVEALPGVDGLYILGKHDPKIDVSRRSAQLEGMDQAYQILDEGHWLRRRKNMREVLQVMLE